MYAAYHNHVGVANVLIEYNCDMDTTDYVIIILFKNKSIILTVFNNREVGVLYIGRQIEITWKLLNY